MKEKLRIFAPATVALSAAALLWAPAAVASPDQFLNELSTNGVSLPGLTPSQTVTAGYEVCSSLKNGASVLDTMSAVEQKYHFNQGTLFVSAATTNLCPDFAG